MMAPMGDTEQNRAASARDTGRRQRQLFPPRAQLDVDRDLMFLHYDYG
jgi:hypothetical protein